MSSSLTDAGYWSRRQESLSVRSYAELSDARSAEWFAVIEKFLREAEGGRLLEIGCSPGHCSALLCSRYKFQAEGVDISDCSDLYKKNLAVVGNVNAIVHKTDIRVFDPMSKYDVVSSFGFVEHFLDVLDILSIHDRFLAVGGLCIVVVPNFRYLQYLYHYLFDRQDLLMHNTACMQLNVYEEYARICNHEILYLGYAGKMRFWNVDLTGSYIKVIFRRILSRLVREAAYGIGQMLPVNKYYSPWIIYVGRKK